MQVLESRGGCKSAEQAAHVANPSCRGWKELCKLLWSMEEFRNMYFSEVDVLMRGRCAHNEGGGFI